MALWSTVKELNVPAVSKEKRMRVAGLFKNFWFRNRSRRVLQNRGVEKLSKGG